MPVCVNEIHKIKSTAHEPSGPRARCMDPTLRAPLATAPASASGIHPPALSGSDVTRSHHPPLRRRDPPPSSLSSPRTPEVSQPPNLASPRAPPQDPAFPRVAVAGSGLPTRRHRQIRPSHTLPLPDPPFPRAAATGSTLPLGRATTGGLRCQCRPTPPLRGPPPLIDFRRRAKSDCLHK